VLILRKQSLVHHLEAMEKGKVAGTGLFVDPRQSQSKERGREAVIIEKTIKTKRDEI